MYHPEPYWNEVAERIKIRESNLLLAGDDEPYYEYKRKKFLELFEEINFRDKIVLEVGSGPGGNLLEIAKHHPKELHGVDISEKMVSISKERLSNTPIRIFKTDGLHLPYPEKYFDLSFTSTVLQHNTDEVMLHRLIEEICRVTSKDIYIFEKIEKNIKGTDLCLGRPVDYYQKIFEKNGFSLDKSRFLNIPVSFFVCGAIRKIFNKSGRKEGEPISKISSVLQSIAIPVTSVFDKMVPTHRELAMLHFKSRI